MGTRGPISERAAGLLMVLASGTCFGALGLFAVAAYDDGAKPATLLFLRFSLASVVLTVLCVLAKQRLPRGRALLTLVLLGAVGYVGQSMAYFHALRHASPGLVALLLYTFPALVALAQVVFFGERLGAQKTIALVLALTGTALTVGPVESARLLGVALGLTAAVVYSVYIVASSRVLRDVEPLIATAVVSASAAAVYALLIPIEGLALPQTSCGWLAVVALAIVSTVFAILLLFLGMRRVGAVVASMLSTTEPLVAVVLSALILGERLTWLQNLGAALILAAVVWLARAQREHGGESKGSAEERNS